MAGTVSFNMRKLVANITFVGIFILFVAIPFATIREAVEVPMIERTPYEDYMIRLGEYFLHVAWISIGFAMGLGLRWIILEAERQPQVKKVTE